VVTDKQHNEVILLVFEQLADILSKEMGKRPISAIANDFNKHRTTIYDYSYGCSFLCDLDFICGLRSLGYDLVIVKNKQKGENNGDPHK